MRKALGMGATAALLIGLIVGVVASNASAAVHNYTATLTGAAETSNPSTYVGSATFRIDDVSNTVCVDSSIDNPVNDPVEAHHLHRGHGFVSPIEINFNIVNDQMSDCVLADSRLIADLIASPDAFSYDVHTKLFPEGAARGQLVVQQTPTSTASSSTVPPTTTTTVACNPNYTGLCIPSNLIASQVNCFPTPAVFQVTVRVRVVGVDNLDLDRNNDGFGCDSLAGTQTVQSAPRFTG